MVADEGTEMRTTTAALERDIGECDRCNYRVLWARTAGNQPQPLDPDPLRPHQVQDRDVAVHRNPLGVLRCRVPTVDYPAARFERMYRPHHATCPASVPAGVGVADDHTDGAGGRVVQLDTFRSRRRPDR